MDNPVWGGGTLYWPSMVNRRGGFVFPSARYYTVVLHNNSQ